MGLAFLAAFGMVVDPFHSKAGTSYSGPAGRTGAKRCCVERNAVIDGQLLSMLLTLDDETLGDAGRSSFLYAPGPGVFLSLYRENTPPKRSSNPLSKAKPFAGFRPRVPLSVSYCPTAGLLSEAAVEKTVALARAGDDGRLGDSRFLDRAGDPSSLPACRKVGEDGLRDLAARDGDGGRSCGARSGVGFKGAFVEPVDVAVEDGAAWAALTGVLVGVAGARMPAARTVSSRAPASSRCRNSAAMSGWLTRDVNSSAAETFLTSRVKKISVSWERPGSPNAGKPPMAALSARRLLPHATERWKRTMATLSHSSPTSIQAEANAPSSMPATSARVRYAPSCCSPQLGNEMVWPLGTGATFSSSNALLSPPAS